MAVHTEVRSGSYIRGLADIRIRDDAELIILMDDGERYVVPYDMSQTGEIKEGTYRVSLSSDGSKLFGITPAKGTYIVRYDGMVAKDGELSEPKLMKGGTRKRKDGKGTWEAPDYLAFTVLLRIVSVVCKGMTIPFQLNYSFEQYRDTDETVIPLGNKNLERTATFLQLAGMDFTVDSIPFSENVLPFIDKLLKSRNMKFQVAIKNGYVDEIFELAPALDD